MRDILKLLNPSIPKAWGDDEKIGHFQIVKIHSHGTFFASPLGGDVEKIRHFKNGEYFCRAPLFLHLIGKWGAEIWGGDLGHGLYHLLEKWGTSWRTLAIFT